MGNNEVFITIISGTVIFVLGQLFIELYIKPLNKYKKTKADIIYFLYRYRSNIYNPIEYSRYVVDINSDNIVERELANEYKVAEKRVQELSAELAEFLENRGLCLILIPSRKRIRNTINALNILSYGMFHNNQNKYDKLKQNMASYFEVIKNLHLKGIENWKQIEKNRKKRDKEDR